MINQIISKLKTNKVKRLVMSLLALLTLTPGFFNNIWKVADKDKFDGFADGTEALMVARMAKSRQSGIFSEGGLIGRELSIPEGRNFINYQFEVYYNNIPIQTYWVYESNPAVHGIIFSILDRYLNLLNFGGQTKIYVYRLIISFISASILCVYLLWTLELFGFFATLMGLLLIVSSPWLTAAGGHLYWMFGTVYLPFLIPLVLLQKKHKGKKLPSHTLLISASTAMLIKCLITGYEFISTTLIMITVPVFFYALWEKWRFFTFVKHFFIVSFSGIIGIIISVFILSLQIAQVEGSMSRGLLYLQQRFIFRTYPTEKNSSGNIPQYIKNGNDIPISKLINEYMADTAVSILIKDKYYSFSFKLFLIIFTVSSTIIFIVSKNMRLIALTITTWVSILAPLSWFVIFKSHSIVHPFLDYLVWYMPTLLLMFVNIFSIPFNLLIGGSTNHNQL